MKKEEKTVQEEGALGQLVLGSCLFHWPMEQWRDFYFKIADEAPLRTVYVGEVVCAKRTPFYKAAYGEVIRRLQAAGKEVILSTYALPTTPAEQVWTEDFTAQFESCLVEANDMAAVYSLSEKKRPFAVGPFINVYNVPTLDFFRQKGACVVSLPSELDRRSLQTLGAARQELPLEVQVFGRLPLALSARCYRARLEGLDKQNCQFVCGEDPDGRDVETLDDQPFLAINGIQTMSYTYANLIQELKDLGDLGIRRFRLWPHSCNMLEVIGLFDGVLRHRLSAEEALRRLREIVRIPFSNGFYYGGTGRAYQEA